MLKVEHLPSALIAPFVTSDQPSFMPNLDVGRQNFRFRPASRAQRRRIEVRPHSHASFTVDHWVADLCQREFLLRQRLKILAFNDHSLADALLSLADHALLIFSTSSQQLPVEVGPIARLRHWRQMIAPEIAHLSFHSAFLIPTRGCAKGCLKAPMRAEGCKPDRFFPLPTAQYLPHCARQVIKAQNSEYSPKIFKGRFVRFQECLLCCTRIGSMKGPSARHAATGEDLRFLPLLSKQDPCFVPINLRHFSPLIGLRNIYFTAAQSHLLFQFSPIPSHGRFSDFMAQFLVDPDVDPVGRVPLFAWRLPIRFQNFIDE